MTLKPYALALVAVFSAGPVIAADLTYDEPTYNEPPAASSSSGWTGAYVGIHAGMGSERSSPFSGDKEFVGGIQGGYNAELGGAVVGGELEYSHLGDTGVDVPGGELKERHRVAAKAKVGMPMGETLIYGTAGMAMTSIRDGNGVDGPDGWKPGYLFGAGVEQNLTGNISAKVEYNYVRTPDVRSTDGVTNSETNVSDHTIKAGLNYKF